MKKNDAMPGNEVAPSFDDLMPSHLRPLLSPIKTPISICETRQSEIPNAF